MSSYDDAMTVMAELFSKDCAFALATVNGDMPCVRMVDTYYEDGAFYVVTHAQSAKAKELAANEHAALCGQAYRFDGVARSIGHPLDPQNDALRDKLINAFAPWYFKHNNELDEAMCYLRIELRHGFFYKDGTGYSVDFANRTAETFPFVFDVVLPA